MMKANFLTKTLTLLISLSLAWPQPALALRTLERAENAAGLEALERALKSGDEQVVRMVVAAPQIPLAAAGLEALTEAFDRRFEAYNVVTERHLVPFAEEQSVEVQAVEAILRERNYPRIEAASNQGGAIWILSSDATADEAFERWIFGNQIVTKGALARFAGAFGVGLDAMQARIQERVRSRRPWFSFSTLGGETFWISDEAEMEDVVELWLGLYPPDVVKGEVVSALAENLGMDASAIEDHLRDQGYRTVSETLPASSGSGKWLPEDRVRFGSRTARALGRGDFPFEADLDRNTIGQRITQEVREKILEQDGSPPGLLLSLEDEEQARQDQRIRRVHDASERLGQWSALIGRLLGTASSLLPQRVREHAQVRLTHWWESSVADVPEPFQELNGPILFQTLLVRLPVVVVDGQDLSEEPERARVLLERQVQSAELSADLSQLTLEVQPPLTEAEVVTLQQREPSRYVLPGQGVSDDAADESDSPDWEPTIPLYLQRLSYPAQPAGGDPTMAPQSLAREKARDGFRDPDNAIWLMGSLVDTRENEATWQLIREQVNNPELMRAVERAIEFWDLKLRQGATGDDLRLPKYEERQPLIEFLVTLWAGPPDPQSESLDAGLEEKGENHALTLLVAFGALMHGEDEEAVEDFFSREGGRGVQLLSELGSFSESQVDAILADVSNAYDIVYTIETESRFARSRRVTRVDLRRAVAGNVRARAGILSWLKSGYELSKDALGGDEGFTRILTLAEQYLEWKSNQAGLEGRALVEDTLRDSLPPLAQPMEIRTPEGIMVSPPIQISRLDQAIEERRATAGGIGLAEDTLSDLRPPTAAGMEGVNEALTELRRFLANSDIVDVFKLLIEPQTSVGDQNFVDLTRFFGDLTGLLQKTGYGGVAELVSLPLKPATPEQTINLYVQEGKSWTDTVKQNLSQEVQLGDPIRVYLTSDITAASVVVGDETVEIGRGQAMIQVNERTAPYVTEALLSYLQEKGMLESGRIVVLQNLYQGEMGEGLLIFA